MAITLLCQRGGTPIPTTDPSVNDTFFNFNINGPGMTSVIKLPERGRGYLDHGDPGQFRSRTSEWFAPASERGVHRGCSRLAAQPRWVRADSLVLRSSETSRSRLS